MRWVTWLLPTPKELVDELELFRRSVRNEWLSISLGWGVPRARRMPSANYEQSVKMGLQRARILNELAAIFNRHWRGFVRDVYGGKVDLYRTLQDTVGDEAKNEARAVEKWFRGFITTEELIDCIAQALQRRLTRLAY
jgi:hypothetical protein